MEDEFAKALDALHSSVDAALHSKSSAPTIQIETNPWTKAPELPVVAAEKIAIKKESKSIVDFWMPMLILGLLGFGVQYVQSYVQKPGLLMQRKEIQSLDADFLNDVVPKQPLQELPNIDLQYLAAIKTQQDALQVQQNLVQQNSQKNEVSANVASKDVSYPKVHDLMANPLKQNAPKVIASHEPKKVQKGFLIVGDIPYIDSTSEEKPMQEVKSSDKILSQSESDQLADQMLKRREQQMMEYERMRQEAEANHMLDD